MKTYEFVPQNSPEWEVTRTLTLKNFKNIEPMCYNGFRGALADLGLEELPDMVERVWITVSPTYVRGTGWTKAWLLHGEEVGKADKGYRGGELLEPSLAKSLRSLLKLKGTRTWDTYMTWDGRRVRTGYMEYPLSVPFYLKVEYTEPE